MSANTDSDDGMEQTVETHDGTPIVSNRSEIIGMFDVTMNNPNGDPSGEGNRPRIDRDTGIGRVTCFRLKRYLRDQLETDGELIYITDAGAETAPDRDDLFERILEHTESDPDEMSTEAFKELLANEVADIRYFGAPLSTDQAPDSMEFTGAVQLTHAESLHPVALAEELSKITTVVSSGEDRDQGTFGENHVVKYGLYGFSGVVNEQDADETRLTEGDVQRLDSLFWRAIQNQTLTQSKVGQQPRLYLRIEYTEAASGNVPVIGDPLRDVNADLGDTPVGEVSGPDDVVVDVTELLAVLEQMTDRIDTVHVKPSRRLQFDVGGTGDQVVGANGFVSALEDTVGADSVRKIDVLKNQADIASTE